MNHSYNFYLKFLQIIIKQQQGILIIILILLISACNNKDSNKTNSKSKTIVLIFKNAPNHNWFTFPSGLRSGTLPKNLISYIDTNSLQIEYSPQKEIDTLTIKNSKNDYLEVLHKFQGFEEIYYLFQTGDTIELTYDENLYPIARSYTSDLLTNQYNFQLKIINRHYKFEFESYSLLTHHYIPFLNKLKRENPEAYNTVFKDRHVDFIDIDTININFDKYICNYKSSLDSLKKVGALSETYFKYYKYLFERKKLGYSISESKYADVKYNKEMELAFLGSFNDTLINYISYVRMVKSYLFDLECNKEGIRIYKSGNGSNPDTKQVFDSISTHSEITPETKNLLLFYCLENIIENFSSEDINIYLEKYNEITQDSIKTNYLISRYNLDFKTSKDLLLVDEKDSQITFEKLLQLHKGKLIYIDFWASWCAPCQQSMPAAKILREEYKNKNVVFIYLAKDDEKSAWVKAVKKLETNYLGENYFIVNSKVSKMINDLEISSIPRYMVFDNKGILVYKNAPSPDTKELRNILDKYLLNN
ncbi:MAG: TlpA family protein disulfide reductase [Bacteroidales bacterium]